MVTGQYDHRTSDTFIIANAPGNEAAFRDEIHGSNFSLTIPDLVTGKYTIEIGLVELQCDGAGQRVFDIKCGDQAIATNLDIFAAAGGKDKVMRIRAEIDYPGNSVHDPLSIQFLARRGDAKLNTFEIWNAAGASLVSMKVADLISGDDAAALIPPVVEGTGVVEGCNATIGNAGERSGEPHVARRKKRRRCTTPPRRFHASGCQLTTIGTNVSTAWRDLV